MFLFNNQRNKKGLVKLYEEASPNMVIYSSKGKGICHLSRASKPQNVNNKDECKH